MSHLLELRVIAKLKDSREVMIAAPAASDAADLVGYLNRTGGESPYLTFGADGIDATVDDERAWVRRMREGEDCALVARVEGEIASTATLTRRSPRPRVRHVGTLGISVGQSFWGLGLGRLMVTTLLGWGRHEGLRKVDLEVRSDNVRAIGLYTSLGFGVEGQRSRGFRSTVSSMTRCSWG